MHLGLQSDPYFTTQNQVEVPRSGTLRRARLPLEATIRISPTLQLTNGLPYDVLGWAIAPPHKDVAGSIAAAATAAAATSTLSSPEKAGNFTSEDSILDERAASAAAAKAAPMAAAAAPSASRRAAAASSTAQAAGGAGRRGSLDLSGLPAATASGGAAATDSKLASLQQVWAAGSKQEAELALAKLVAGGLAVHRKRGVIAASFMAHVRCTDNKLLLCCKCNNARLTAGAGYSRCTPAEDCDCLKDEFAVPQYVQHTFLLCCLSTLQHTADAGTVWQMTSGPNQTVQPPQGTPGHRRRASLFARGSVEHGRAGAANSPRLLSSTAAGPRVRASSYAGSGLGWAGVSVCMCVCVDASYASAVNDSFTSAALVLACHSALLVACSMGRLEKLLTMQLITEAASVTWSMLHRSLSAECGVATAAGQPS